MNRRTRSTACALIAAAIIPAAAQALHAQTIVAVPTGYFWNAPTGGSGTWDNVTQIWSSVGSAGPVDYTWQSNGLERANFGNTAGTVTIAPGGVTAAGISFNITGYTLAAADPSATLTLVRTDSTLNIGGANTATISAPIAGTDGLNKIGAGTVTLNAANTFTGGLLVSGGGTLAGVAQTAGSPFGDPANAVTLDSSNLRLNGIAANTSTQIGDLTVLGTSPDPSGNLSTLPNTSPYATGLSSITLDNTTGGAANTTTLAAGNLIRGGAGAVLAIVPVTGSLGAGEQLTFTNGTALSTNGILPAWVVTTPTPGSNAVDFTSYNPGTGVTVANYSSSDLSTATASSVVNQATDVALSADAAAYALKTNANIDLGAHTLTLGNGSDTAGLILNNASITNGNLNVRAIEGLIHFSGNNTLGSTGNTLDHAGNLTFTASGPASLTINSSITNPPTGASHVTYNAPTLGSSITLNAPNSYTGGTTLSFNSTTAAAPNLILNDDLAFGTGKVTTILNGSSPEFQSNTGPRTLANAFDLASGLNFLGANNFTLTGPLTIINPASGAARTIQVGATATGYTLTLGDPAHPSTITVGNPSANGGDDVGKNVILQLNANTTIVLNDVIQDPAPGGGASSANVTYLGPTNGTFVVNSLNTYSGSTFLNGGNSAIQFNHDFHAGDPSGPFGTGTLVANASTNNFLEPVGGNRTLANPVSMVTGFTVANAPSDTSSITFTGPITLTSPTGRTLQNNLNPGATLTLGDSAAPSTLTLSTGANAALQIAGGGSTPASTITVINDVIQDNGTPGPVNISSIGTVVLNALNTYSGNTTLTGGTSTNQTILPITLSSNGIGAAFTAGPFGVGNLVPSNGNNAHLRPTGADRSLSNPVTLTFGIAMDNNPGESFNLTMAGPITTGSTGRFLSNGFAAGSSGGTFIIGDPNQPSTVTLSTAANQNDSFAALAGNIIINDVIQNAPGVAGNIQLNPNASNSNSITINSQNTYSGTTKIGGSGAGSGGVVILNASSVGSPGSLSSGPFGTGTVIMNMTNSSSTPPVLEPANADRTVANAITLTSGFFAANTPSTNFNLNLTGPITLISTAGRIITNNLAPGATLTLGDSAAPSTLTLGSTASATTTATTIAFQTTTGSTARTVVNDIIQDNPGSAPGNITVQNGATVLLTAANTYSGATNVTGGTLILANSSGSATGSSVVNITGAGTLASGGTLAGNGSITGLLTVSSTTTTPTNTQGGILSPGNSATEALPSPGTLHLASAAFDPLGQYLFQYNPADNTPGNAVNDLLAATGALDLSNLAPGAAFDLDLQPLTPGAALNAYTLATFAQGIFTAPGSSLPDGADVTNLFTFSGAPDRAPLSVTIAGAPGGPQSLQLHFTAVPEPTTLTLLALPALSLLTRRRRNHA